jgi:hypothetical protein
MKLASPKLLRLAKRFARASSAAIEAELAFMEQLSEEFPDCETDNDGIAENLTYGGFDTQVQTRERLTEIIHGAY